MENDQKDNGISVATEPVNDSQQDAEIPDKDEHKTESHENPTQALDSQEAIPLKMDDSIAPIEIISNVLIQSETVPEQIMQTDEPIQVNDEMEASSTNEEHATSEEPSSIPPTSEQAPQITEDTSEQVIVEPVPEIPQITTQALDDSYTQNILKSLNTGGLGLLSAYDSGDDSDASDSASVIEVPSNEYRNQVIEIDSDDDSSSSSSEEENCDLQKKRNELEKMIQVDDSDEEEEGFKRQPPKVQGELLLEDLPPIEDLHITVPEQECEELGTVHSVVEQLLLVKTIPGTPLLDIGTVLFMEKGQKVLGEIFDVLGQVADPLYCVRFNNNQHIKEKQINIGDKVYCAPRTEHTQLIILSNLTKMKGSDASWENDVEPPAKYVEYSDDEEEQAARRARRTKARNEYRPDDGEVVDLTNTKRPKQQNSNRGPPQNRQPRQQQAPQQQYYQQMHQQQPFNYQSEGNTWHSNFQPQYVMNPYAMQQPGAGNFQQGYPNQNNGGYQQRNFNNRNNRNYQQRGNNYPQPQGPFQQQGNYHQQPQGSQQYYQGQAPFYQQGGGGYQ